MTDRFINFWPFLVAWEGAKFENDPDDPGNYVNGKLVGTKFGIDARSHPNEDIRNLTEDRAKEIYWESYWQKYGCEDYDYPLGEVVFNCCVNAGYGRAQKIFTTGATTASEFLDEQEAFYERLAEAKPTMKKYLKGWLNRTQALRKFLDIT